MTGKSLSVDVTAVVVTYRPDLALLVGVLANVELQVDRVVVVDNGSAPGVVAWLEAWESGAEGRTAKLNGENLGIAAAFNQGIAIARQHAARHVLLLDQDSEVMPGMVSGLLAALYSESAAGHRVGAAGPVFVDRRTLQPSPFVRIGWLINRKLPASAEGVVEADFLISSGCLIPMEVLAAVGDMYEPLFIDNVDLEWSFRVRKAGYRLIGVGCARMAHAIGDRVMNIGGEKGLSISLHGPVRLYYMTRNRIWLYQQAATPAAWISQDIPRLLLKAVGMSLFAPPRWRNARAMALGMFDAATTRLGICRHRT